MRPTLAVRWMLVNTWQTVHMTTTVLQTETDLDRCCPPVAGAVMSPSDAEHLAQSLKAIADPTRLRLLSLVASRVDGEACVCEMTEPVGLTQGTVSHHLKVLVDAGLLQREQRGKWAYYRLIPHAIADVAQLVTAVTS